MFVIGVVGSVVEYLDGNRGVGDCWVVVGW